MRRLTVSTELETELRTLLVKMAYVSMQREAGLRRLAKMRMREVQKEYEAIRAYITERWGNDMSNQFDTLVDNKVGNLKLMAHLEGTAKLESMMHGTNDNIGAAA